MKDLTQGPIHRHVLEMAAPMAAGMIIQTLYYLVDLYFVGKLGDTAIAGVSSAGIVMFIIMAMTQMLGVGTVALIAQAVGRKDAAEANLVFNQSLVLSLVCGLATLVGGYALATPFLQLVSADAGTLVAGRDYLFAYLPGLALQFAMIAMGSALRGTGIVKPTMIVQALTILINIALAPVLIAGWGTGKPLGVAGAGLATSISVAVGVVLAAIYFVRYEKYVSIEAALWAPRWATWKRLLGIGLPAGAEFALMFVFMTVIYWITRDFGAAAQAGYGVGSRVMQAIFLPAMAIAFAAAPIAGQNFGAQNGARVHETFRKSAWMGAAVMAALTLFAHWRPEWFIQAFTSETAVVQTGAEFLRIVSWNFVASGFIFTCSGMFQALGNTWPSLLSSGTRLLTFAMPAIWMSRQPNFEIRHVWYLSVTTVTLQALLSYALVRRELRRLVDVLGTPKEVAS